MYSGEHAEKRGHRLLRNILFAVFAVVVVLAMSWLMRVFIFQAYKIPTGSMEETILSGDMVFTEKVSYRFSDPAQGDIVTFQDPEIPSRILIKRVIAVGGQTVDLVDGHVLVDGVALDEPYVDGRESYPLTPAYGTSVSYPYEIPKGEIWVMGDNRTNSQDSRYFGSIGLETVLGKAVVTYWPVEHFRLLS